MRELSVVEQRYKAVQEVISDGMTVTEVAARHHVSRQTLHTWLARYEAGGLDELVDGSHRPPSCPHQMAGELEALVLELRRWKHYWGPRSLVLELARRRVAPLPSQSAVYRCLVRAGVIQPARGRRRIEHWKRWERGGPMELWQMDVVGGVLLADSTAAKVLTGIDDHSRFCVSAKLMPRERTKLVCDGFAAALRTHGVPEQVLTDNGKVFTGRFAQPPVEVLFDRICRENGIEHILTQPRSPTTTGKVERFHKTIRLELNTRQVFKNLTTARAAVDEWVLHYNTERPHRSRDDVTPASRFKAGNTAVRTPDSNAAYWVSRKVTSNGIVCVGYQKVNVGMRHAGSACNILVRDGTLQFWVGRQLVKTEARATKGVIRKKNSEGQAPGTTLAKDCQGSTESASLSINRSQTPADELELACLLPDAEMMLLVGFQ
jgi:transposase InsO family protein